MAILSSNRIDEILCSSLSEKCAAPTVEDVQCICKDKGYLSDITRVRLRWPCKDSKLPTSVIIKVITDRKIDKEVSKLNKLTGSHIPVIFPEGLLEKLHGNECLIYELFEEDVKHLPTNLTVPRCYGSDATHSVDDPGYLILQDLTMIAKPQDLMQGFTLDQCEELMKFIAALQAWGFRQKNSKLEFIKPVLLQKEVFGESFAESVLEMFHSLKRAFPSILTFDAAKLRTVFGCETQNVFEALDIESESFTPTLAHGDLWCNNVFFYADEDTDNASDDLACVLDWQTVRMGNPAEDIARVLILCTDASLRRQNEDGMIRVYFRELQRNLPAGFPLPFDLDEVTRQYRRLFHYASARLIMFCAQHHLHYQEDQANNDDSMSTMPPASMLKLLRRTEAALDDAFDYFSRQQ